MLKKALAVIKNERGGALAEYGLLIALIAVVCIVVIAALGTNIAAKFKEVGTKIKEAEPYQ